MKKIILLLFTFLLSTSSLQPLYCMDNAPQEQSKQENKQQSECSTKKCRTCRKKEKKHTKQEKKRKKIEKQNSSRNLKPDELLGCLALVALLLGFKSY